MGAWEPYFPTRLIFLTPESVKKLMYIQLDLGNSLEMVVTRFSSKLPEETNLFARDFA